MGYRVVGVTGAGGLLGRQLVRSLAAGGYELRLMVRRRLELPGIQVEGDIRDRAAVERFTQGCDAVVHLAGIAHTALRTEADRVAAEGVNVGGSRNVLVACRSSGVERVVVVSSAHVYAGQEGTGLYESAGTAGDSFYARAKLMVEKAALEAASGGASVVIARPCLVYGPEVRFNLESLMRAIRRRYYFHIRGVNPQRSLLSVGNAAAALEHLLRAGAHGGIYNLADRCPVGLVEFTNSLADRMGVARPVRVPMGMIRAGVGLMGPLERMGLRVPLNREGVRKLTTSFTLDTGALAATGFQWRDDAEETRDRMVEWFLRTSSRRA